MTERNVLWLNNHVTACRFECDLLREFGFKVFVPKYFPSQHRSFAITYEYDADLDIPNEELEILNQHDFYAPYWPEAVLAILNRHFDTAIIACFSDLIYETVAGFRGRILLRSYGPFHEDALVWDFLQSSLKPGIRRKLAEVGDRFWFAEAYPNLADPEHDFLKRRRVNLPTGIPEAIQSRQGTYRRAIEKILIVLPDIAAGDHQSAAAYPQVKRHFARLPKIIAGKQGAPVDDPDVAGMIPAGEYEELLGGAAAMFYHNVNRRHIHYHPVEAACLGMPVIFMESGMLGVLGGVGAPGACRTYEEAERKLARILRNDEAFIQDVVAAQKPWVDYFMSAWNREAWSREFVGRVIAKSPRYQERRRKRVALIFTREATAFFPEMAAALARSLQAAAGADAVEVVIALWVGAFGEADRSVLQTMGWQVRLFEWQVKTGAEVSAALEFTGRRVRLLSERYIAPLDMQGSLQDCDAWMLEAGQSELKHPLAPLKPIVLCFQNNLSTIPNSVMREMISSAKAVGLSPYLGDRSRARLSVPLDCFPIPPLLPSFGGGRAIPVSDRAPLVIVLPRTVTEEQAFRLQTLLGTVDGHQTHVTGLVIVLAPEPVSSVGAHHLTLRRHVGTIITEFLGGHDAIQERSIEVPGDWMRIRRSIQACRGICFPSDEVFDIGLLAFAALHGVVVVGPPSDRLADASARLGLIYGSVEAFDMASVENRMRALRTHASEETKRVAAEQSRTAFSWSDVAANL